MDERVGVLAAHQLFCSADAVVLEFGEYLVTGGSQS
jgi:hypothetical protein